MSDGRFYVERIRGGRVVGTVIGATYERATVDYARHGIVNGDDIVRVRGFQHEDRPGGPDSPLVYELKRGCRLEGHEGHPFDRCACSLCGTVASDHVPVDDFDHAWSSARPVELEAAGS